MIGYLGEGGMQYVYRAHDRVLDRDVALKTPKNSAASKRFKRSAVLSASVNHPNVAKTLDYLEVDEQLFLIEELIEGTDLDRALLSEVKHVDPYLAAKIFHHIAKGVAAAHHAGVVHRDLKPTNIMSTGGLGVVELKVTDFGIAKMAEEEIVEAVEGGSSTITTSRTALGALPYMAPEAIDTPRDVGRPADIWSIGAMMYHLMTGETPYGVGLRVVAKILEAAPPVFPAFVTSNPQFSPLSTRLIALVHRCMAKDPLNRPTADELVQLCGELCYPVTLRYRGRVKDIRYDAWGFINCGGADVFFHNSSVYGDKPKVNDQVVFSSFDGDGAFRAHPVMLIRRG
ncbi:protein kinase domain-containing protein [Burkholderia sp. Ac-20379]|uniref:protein kinase domain-containing protein n=1 Tax=Burkholderia sp. Ac-20379 TaxID=2703900 RepID=UPI00197F6CE2